MVEFIESDHNKSMRRHESALGAAKASNQDARAQSRQRIEDSLVAEGMSAVDDYVRLLNKRWDRANCLAEYDGLRMGYGIANRAKARIEALQSDSAADPT